MRSGTKRRSTRTHTTQPSLTVNGYRVYAVTSQIPRWKFFDIPQLGIRIATHGTLGPRIVHTLAASAPVVALDPGYAVALHNWRGVERDGVSLSIPRSRKVMSAHLLCGGPIGSSQLVLIDAKTLFAPCPYRIPKAAEAAYDAADLYLTAHDPNAPRPTGHAIAHVQHGTTTVTGSTRKPIRRRSTCSSAAPAPTSPTCSRSDSAETAEPPPV